MGRSGYSDDVDDHWALIRYRGQVASATRGRRGQALLREMLAALDAMPEKRLIQDEMQDASGDVCALGAVAKARSDAVVVDINPEDDEAVAKVFGIASCLAREIAFVNDEGDFGFGAFETPESRWKRVRAWVAGQINEKAVPGGE